MSNFLIFILCVAVFAAILPLHSELLFAQDAGEDKFEPVSGIVLANEVNVRAGGGLNFEVLGQVNRGEQVVVIGQEYSWYKIKLPPEAKSYVHKDYIHEGVVKADKLRVRAGAGINFNVLGILEKGEMVDILVEDNNWLRIVPPEGTSGWIKKDYLKLSPKKLFSRHFKPVLVPPQEKQEQKPEQKKVEASGIVDELGKIINRQGTHKLIADKKVIYYLKSENIDLNRYVYQKVSVIGKLIDLENSLYSLIEVEQIKEK